MKYDVVDYMAVGTMGAILVLVAALLFFGASERAKNCNAQFTRARTAQDTLFVAVAGDCGYVLQDAETARLEREKGR